MKLWRCSGSKRQNVEDGIGSRPLGLLPDPFLDVSQPFGRLMDVVALGDVRYGLDQRFETRVPSGDRTTNLNTRATPRHANYRARSIDLSHPIAFPRGAPAPTAETGLSALTQQHRDIG
jgi:hypothetical protein